MKKYISVIVGIALLGVLAYVSRNKSSSGDPNQGLDTSTKSGASAIHAHRIQPQGEDTASSSSLKPSEERISQIDPSRPEYATAIAMLEQSFFSSLRRGIATQDKSDEQLYRYARALAAARLSQTMYEATVANVVKAGDDSVTISIPTYSAEGDQLKGYVLNTLLSDLKVEKLENDLTRQFAYFGRYSQSLEIRPNGTDRGQKIYVIEHQTNVTTSFGFVRTGSILPASQLGGYTPFVGWLPKHG